MSLPTIRSRDMSFLVDGRCSPHERFVAPHTHGTIAVVGSALLEVICWGTSDSAVQTLAFVYPNPVAVTAISGNGAVLCGRTGTGLPFSWTQSNGFMFVHLTPSFRRSSYAIALSQTGSVIGGRTGPAAAYWPYAMVGPITLQNTNS